MATKGFSKPQELTEINKDNVLWCMFCSWHMPDNYSNRRRFGSHICNKHYDEVAFPKGTKPPELIEDGAINI